MTKFWITLGVLLLLAAFAIRYRTLPRQPTPAASATQKTNRRVYHFPRGPSPKPEAAALRTLPLSCADGSCTLPVKISLAKKCFSGDFDLVTSEMKAAPGARLIVSLEPMRADLEQPGAAAILPTDSLASATASLTFPQVGKRTLAGLWLCRDSENQRGCRGKTAIDTMSAVMQDANGAKGKNFQPTDKKYFFAPLILDRKELAFSSSEDDAKLPIPTWKIRLDYLLFGADDEDFDPDNQAMVSTISETRQLHSIAPLVDKDALGLPLTTMDMGCLK